MPRKNPNENKRKTVKIRKNMQRKTRKQIKVQARRSISQTKKIQKIKSEAAQIRKKSFLKKEETQMRPFQANKNQ